MTDLLQIEDLRAYFFTRSGAVRAVDGVNLTVSEGETLGLVGESGCGKSTLGLAILGLVPPPGRIVSGRIRFEGKDLVRLTESERRHLRGRKIAMILQDPMTSVNPVLTIGYQIGEPLREHLGLRGGILRDRIVDLLRQVRIPSPELRVQEYPHQFSGGMRQRAVTAMALAARPRLLIADEPTTALDVTVQAQMLRLFRDLQRENGFSMILITHDLGIVEEVCQRVAIMYAGEIVEIGATRRVFARPWHPYTASLLRAIPHLGQKVDRLTTIEGQPPDLRQPLVGCRFAPRCPAAMSVCQVYAPPVSQPDPDGIVACWLHVAAAERPSTGEAEA
jgi:oligopeptide/dipeptide ABC transporter ATP-binding protein